VVFMIIGTLGLSVVFVGAIVVSAAIQLETGLLSWFIFEIVIHGCLYGAIVLETIVVHFFLPEKRAANSSNNTVTKTNTNSPQ